MVIGGWFSLVQSGMGTKLEPSPIILYRTLFPVLGKILFIFMYFISQLSNFVY